MKRTKKPNQINSELTINKLSYSGTESRDWSAPNLGDFDVSASRWSDLSRSERSDVASHFLIGSSNADDFGELKFPVVSPNGNLNESALRAVISGRGAQIQGVSADKRAAARRRAYRLLNSEFDAGLEIPDNLEAAEEKQHPISFNQVSTGNVEIMQKLQQKLDSMDNDFYVHYLEEFSDEKVIYRVSRQHAGGDKYYRQSYTVNDDDSVELNGEPEEVNKKVDVSYTPVQQQSQKQNVGGKNMNNTNETGGQNQGCCPEKVEAVINASVNGFVENDREKLQAMTEEDIDKIPTEEPKAPEPTANQNQQNQQVDFNTLLQNADPELHQSIERGRELYRQERQDMVQRILDNSDQFNQEELDKMEHIMLQKVANSIKPATNYKGASGASTNFQEELEEGIGMPWVQQQTETAKQQ